MERLYFAPIFAWAAVFIGVVGYVFSNSMAVLTDVIHSALDSLGITLAVIAHLLLTRSYSVTYTYGYHRVETLTMMFNLAFLIPGLAYVLYESLTRLLNPVRVNAVMMFISSVVVLTLNITVVALFKGRREANLKAAYLHALLDLGSTIAAMAAAILIMFGMSTRLDAVIALIVVTYLSYRAFSLAKSAYTSLLDKSPIDVEKVVENLGLEVHDIHIWSPCPDYKIATLHIRVNKNLTVEQLDSIRQNIEEKLKTFGIGHVTVQFEHGPCTASHNHQ